MSEELKIKVYSEIFNLEESFVKFNIVDPPTEEGKKYKLRYFQLFVANLLIIFVIAPNIILEMWNKYLYHIFEYKLEGYIIPFLIFVGINFIIRRMTNFFTKKEYAGVEEIIYTYGILMILAYIFLL